MANRDAPRKSVRTAAPRTKVRTRANGSGMSADHKKALAAGREEGRAVRNYLEALESFRPKRGRKRTPEGIRKRISDIDSSLAGSDPLTRVHLVQERLDLQAKLNAATPERDLSVLEAAFVKAVGSYSARKGITYAAWRAAGVDAQVLKRAGISRTRI